MRRIDAKTKEEIQRQSPFCDDEYRRRTVCVLGVFHLLRKTLRLLAPAALLDAVRVNVSIARVRDVPRSRGFIVHNAWNLGVSHEAELVLCYPWREPRGSRCWKRWTKCRSHTWHSRSSVGILASNGEHTSCHSSTHGVQDDRRSGQILKHPLYALYRVKQAPKASPRICG